MRSAKVLLIDDEQKLCRMLKQRLERRGGYEVTLAHTGEEGLEKAGAAAFDVVITDFQMPGMNGGRVLKALKAAQPNLPVILLTIYHDDTSVVTPDLQSLADHLLAKPINAEQLFDALERLLNRTPEHRQEA